MAAILARLLDENRRRRLNKQLNPEISSDKCVYEIQPFDSGGFRPEKHNPYLRRKMAYMAARGQRENHSYSTITKLKTFLN